MYHHTSPHPTISWLKDFAAAVRERDLDRGRAMFSRDAFGFGTVAERAEGLDTLVNTQWRRVWLATHGFDFDYKTIKYGGEEPIYWVAAQWSSFGRDDAGIEVERRGRSTFALQRINDKLLAVHSHFSFVPSGVVTPPAAASPACSQRRLNHLVGQPA